MFFPGDISVQILDFRRWVTLTTHWIYRYSFPITATLEKFVSECIFSIAVMLQNIYVFFLFTVAFLSFLLVVSCNPPYPTFSRPTWLTPCSKKSLAFPGRPLRPLSSGRDMRSKRRPDSSKESKCEYVNYGWEWLQYRRGNSNGPINNRMNGDVGKILMIHFFNTRP